MEYEMNSSSIYEKEETLSRSNVVELLINSKECVFTVIFHKQADAEYIKTQIVSAPSSTWGNSNLLKELSK